MEKECFSETLFCSLIRDEPFSAVTVPDTVEDCVLITEMLLLTLAGCHDDGQSRDWIAVMRLLCSKLVPNWLKCFYPAGNGKQRVTKAK